MKFLFWGVLVFSLVLRIIFSKTEYLEGKKIRITSTVHEEPVKYSFFQKISLKSLDVYLPKYPEISYGDKVVVEGVVIEGKLEKAELLKLEKSQGILIKFREKILEFYQKSLPEPHAALIAGITLGVRGEIPDSFWRGLTNSGLAHVVVASGSNVSLVAGFLVGILTLFIARRKAIPLLLIGIWLYAGLSGMDAPIIRAAIMGSITFSAQGIGRLSSAWRALVISAFIMLLIKPDWIADLGFLLSFVATACLMLFQGKIAKRLKKVPTIFREGLSTSLAAQIGVTPILFVTFGQFNILSPIANALVLWAVPIIMVVGGISGLIGLIFPLIGRILLYLVYPLTSWFIFIVNLFD
jgi:competence protein ComEC